MAERERRLVFGEIAEVYDAARPTYPAPLVDDLAGWARAAGDPPTALEVGAGTGIATRLLAARGIAVTAVEPSAEMVDVARRGTVGAGAAVEAIQSDFEHAELDGRTFGLVYAAQSWHWVGQPEGYARARAALPRGGRLVVFWNRPRWEGVTLREALNDAYETHIPVELHGGPLHPAPGGASTFVGWDWEREVSDVDGFAAPEVREYDWTLPYTAAGYAELLSTISEVRLLSPAARDRFLADVVAVITDHGDGAFEMPMSTRACLAQAA